MTIPDIIAITKAILDIFKKKETKTLNYTEVRGNYLDLRGSKVTLNIGLKDYYDNFSKLENKENKIIITKKKQKINPVDYINTISKQEKFIKDITKTDLRQPYLAHILYSIHIESKMKNYQDFIKEKNSNPVQIRIFNLYYSGWIKLILDEYFNSKEKYSFHEEFEKLVYDKSKVFIHSDMSIQYIKRILLNNFLQKKLNIINLHAIGKNNNRTVKLTIRELQEDGYNIEIKIEKQINEGNKYLLIYF